MVKKKRAVWPQSISQFVRISQSCVTCHNW